MRFAYSSNAFTRHSLEYAIHAIAKLGFTGIELLCDTPHWFPGRVSENEIRKTATLLRSLGLHISNLNANTVNGHYHPPLPENVFEPSLTHPDPAIRQIRCNYIFQALQMATSIGADTISITSGRPKPGCLPADALDYFVASLKTLCCYADDLGIRIGIEYEPGLVVEKATDVAEIIARVDKQCLGVNFDIGHSYLNGEDPQAAVETLSGRIWNVHVEDIKDGRHFHLPPGQGDLPFQLYFDALQQHHYDGFLTVELYSFPDTPNEVGAQSLKVLRTMIPE